MQPSAIATSAVQPIVVNLLPAGNGWLQYTQVIGTLVIALIAAGIAGTIQWRQMQIARGALRTADNKLRFDLFDKRLDIFEAGIALLTDKYLSDDDPNPEGDFTRLLALVDRTTGAGWLIDSEAQTFLTQLVNEAHARYKDLMYRQERIKKAWEEKGRDTVVDEVQADWDRQKRQQAQLIDLFPTSS